MANELGGVAADTELNRASGELHTLNEALEELRGCVGRFLERALGAVPHTAQPVDRAEQASPVFNNGATGDVRRGISNAMDLTHTIIGMTSYLGEIV